MRYLNLEVLFTFSVAAGDVTSLVLSKFYQMSKYITFFARTLGDINAINKTMQIRWSTTGGAVGERFARRLTGRAAGSVVRQC